MTRRRRLFLRFSVVLTFVAALFAGGNFISYAWLNAAAPERWPAGRAAPLVYGSLALAVLFLVAFVCFVVVLIRDANRRHQEESNAT
jgi:hypothetical protein